MQSSTPINEETSTIPSDVYGLTKLVAENVIEKWAKKKNCKCQILRFGPIYGPGDSRTEFLLERLIFSSAYGKEMNLSISSSTCRNYIYVFDLCSMIIESIFNDSEKKINIVSNKNYSIEEIVCALQRCSAFTINYTNPISGKDIIFDGSLCGYEYKTTITPLEQGLSTTINWILSDIK